MATRLVVASAALATALCAVVASAITDDDVAATDTEHQAAVERNDAQTMDRASSPMHE